MNTGERLVQLSGLPSGSALAHFAAITQTGGTGPGSLLLVSKAAIQISYPEHRYHREAAQSFVLDTGNEASVTSDDKSVAASKNSVFTAQESVFCTNTRLSIAAFLPPKEVVVMTEVLRNTVSYDLGDTLHVR